MTRGQKVADWYRGHAPWLAVITLASATFGYGYCLATVQARADRADEVAKTVAAYQAALNAKDQLIIRLAGSAVKASDQAADAADQIRQGILTKLFMIDKGEQDGSFVNFKGNVSCSAGVASFHDHVRIQGTLREKKNLFIRMADQAMYKAKALGKNRVFIAE